MLSILGRRRITRILPRQPLILGASLLDATLICNVPGCDKQIGVTMGGGFIAPERSLDIGRCHDKQQKVLIGLAVTSILLAVAYYRYRKTT